VWNFLAREAAKRIGGTIAANKIAGTDAANEPEAYADRIKRDFHLHDYADAWALYDSDRTYWENYYYPRPNGSAWNTESVQDSAAAAGVPSRNNVFEYGFPEANSAQPSIGEAPRVGSRNGLRGTASSCGILLPPLAFPAVIMFSSTASRRSIRRELRSGPHHSRRWYPATRCLRASSPPARLRFHFLPPPCKTRPADYRVCWLRLGLSIPRIRDGHRAAGCPA
jgi:hypothetical protein